MARKKEAAKPLFGLKHDFYESLDASLQAGINLIQNIETAILLDGIAEPHKSKVSDALAAYRASLMSDE